MADDKRKDKISNKRKIVNEVRKLKRKIDK